MSGKREEIVEIQPLVESQLDEAGRVYAEAFNSANVGEHWDPSAATQFLRHLWKAQPDLFFVAMDEGRIAGGTAGLIKPWHDGRHLYDTELFVHTKYQGQGLAKKLMSELISTAVEKYGIVEFEGVADESKHDFPMSWYERIGIRRTGWVHIAGDPGEILDLLESDDDLKP